MADLYALIRLQKHRVEEKQKIVADLFRQAELVEGRKQELLEREAREREVLEKNNLTEGMDYFLKFSELIKNDVERLNGELVKIEKRIDFAQEEVRQIFVELKRIEIVQRNREQREADKRRKQEEQELNEVAIEGFRRSEEGV